MKATIPISFYIDPQNSLTSIKQLENRIEKEEVKSQSSNRVPIEFFNQLQSNLKQLENRIKKEEVKQQNSNRVPIEFYYKLQNNLKQLESRIKKEEDKRNNINKKKLRDEPTNLDKELQSKIVIGKDTDFVPIQHYIDLLNKLEQLEIRIEKEEFRITSAKAFKMENKQLKVEVEEKSDETEEQFENRMKKLLEESNEVPVGLQWVENSCYLDSLVQIFLTSDSTYLKTILLEEDIESFNYDERLIEKCQTNSSFSYMSTNSKDIIDSLRRLAERLRNDLKRLNQAVYSDNQTCVVVRETLSLCMRDLFTKSSYHFDINTLEQKVIEPLYDEFSVRGNVKKDANILFNFIHQNAEQLQNVTTFAEFARIFRNSASLKSLGLKENAYFPLARKVYELSVKNNMAKAVHAHPLDVYTLFARAFPPLMLTTGDATLTLNEEILALFPASDLAKNKLIVFNNTFQTKDLRPILKNKMEWGHESFLLVAIVNWVNGNHYTSCIRYRGVWYYYDDLAPKEERFSRIEQLTDVFFTFRNNILPYIFFYARHDFIF